jgi:predicted Zn-dependent protease
MRKLKVFLFGEKDTLAKRIVNYGLIFLVIAGITEYGIDHNGDMSGLLKKETWDVNNDTMYVVSIGHVSNEKLKNASNTVEKYFGQTTKIIQEIELSQSMYIKGTDLIDVNKFIKSVEENDRYLFVTNKKLYFTNIERGVYGLSYNKSIVVKSNSEMEETIVHEMGHIKGLSHCKNKRCIMSTYDDGYTTDYGIHFCDDCSSKITLNENI